MKTLWTAIQPCWAIIWALALLNVSAEDDVPYQLTTNVLNPGPIPGQPFAITWTGGTPDSVVYVVLNYLFPNTPNQDINYASTDILCELSAILILPLPISR